MFKITITIKFDSRSNGYSKWEQIHKFFSIWCTNDLNLDFDIKLQQASGNNL